MPSPTQSPAGTEGSVLLVEEYDALGAAIKAALKKFAPAHSVRVVPTLEEARAIAFKTPPDLLIVDFDPPLPGALEFLAQLRGAAPAMRVLIIAAGIPHEICRGTRPPTGLTFLEKPFQLEDLGTAVQSLIHQPDAAASESLGATITELNLADVIPLLGIEGVSEIVHVRVSAQELEGEIHFERGQIHHAMASGLEGIDALREMLRWPAPDFSRAESKAEGPRSIEGRWPVVLKNVLRSLPRSLPAPVPTVPRAAPPKDVPPPKAPPPIVKDGKKVLVIDDTETLRDFVQEMLITADPRLQIVCAENGGDGVVLSRQFQPDLILLDYSLPDFNGDEVCRRLLEDETTSGIPIIMMSGHVAEMADTAERFENVVLTLSKPFVSAALVAAVAKTLDKAAEPRPRQKQPTKPKAEPKTEALKPEPPPPPRVEAPPPPPPPVVEPPPPPLTPAHIPAASADAVVLSIPLEVVSMQFSAALRISAIRARPPSPAVLLYVDPRAASAVRLPETAFEIAQAELNARGQLENVRIVPAQRRPTTLSPHTIVPVDRLSVLPASANSGIQITPASNAHMTIQLLVAFDLAGVELSPSFDVSCFALHARGGRVRVLLPGQGGKVGIAFETANVLLDPFSRIAEISLDCVVT